MAKQRKAEVAIEATVEGLDDVQALEEAVEEVQDAAEDGVELEVETKDAESNVDRLFREVEDLTDDGKELRIEFRAQVLQQQIRSTLRQLERLDDPVDIQVKQDELVRAQDELKELSQKAGERLEIDIDVDPKRNAQRAAGDIDLMRERGEGMQSALPALRGFTDELGGTAQQAGVAGQAIGDLGDFSLIMGEKFGISSGATTALGTALGTAGLATVILGVALPALQELLDGTEAVTFATEDFIAAQEALEQQNLERAAAAMADAFGPIITKATEAGFALETIIPYLAGTSNSMRTLADDVDYTDDNVRQITDDLREARNVFGTAGEAVELTADATALFGEELGVVPTDEATDGLEDMEGAADEFRQTLDKTTEAQKELTGALDAMSDEAKFLDMKDAVDDFTAAVGSGELSLREARQEQLKVNQTILDYATNVLALPPEVVTDIKTQLDQGDVEAVERRLEALTRARNMLINVDYVLPENDPSNPGNYPNLSSTPTVSTTRGRTAPRTVTNNNTVSVSVTAQPTMRQVDQAVRRWRRLNG